MDMNEFFKQAQKKQMEDMHERRTETIIKVAAALYDKAAAYTNLILAAGYVGYFAMWSNAKDLMAPWEMRTSALLMLFSIAVFVFWEVAKMIYTSMGLHGQVATLKVPLEQFDATFRQFELASNKRTLAMARWWPVVLVLAISTALAGAGVMIYSFVRELAAPLLQ